MLEKSNKKGDGCLLAKSPEGSERSFFGRIVYLAFWDRDELLWATIESWDPGQTFLLLWWRSRLVINSQCTNLPVIHLFMITGIHAATYLHICLFLSLSELANLMLLRIITHLIVFSSFYETQICLIFNMCDKLL